MGPLSFAKSRKNSKVVKSCSPTNAAPSTKSSHSPTNVMRRFLVWLYPKQPHPCSCGIFTLTPFMFVFKFITTIDKSSVPYLRASTNTIIQQEWMYCSLLEYGRIRCCKAIRNILFSRILSSYTIL